MKKRRIISIITLILAIMGVKPSTISLNASDDTGTKTYTGLTGEFAISSVKAMQYRFTVKLDFDWFIYGDNTTYYSELAKLAVTSSNAIYSSPCDTKEGDIPGYDIEFAKAIGFDDVNLIEVNSNNNIDIYDSTTMILAHKKVERNNKPYEIIFATLKGSLSTSDWYSNFDVGADTQEYYDLTGEHPEWLESQKVMHKGFAVTANRSKQRIDEYINNYVDNKANKIILLTGHSRGASIANILGTFYEDDKETFFKTFTYTFAAASTTTVSKEEASKYKTIFNVVNEDDMVPFVPLNKWNDFKLYGNTLVKSCMEYKEMYDSIAYREYVSADGSNLAKLFETFASSREELYKIDYSEKTYVEKGKYLFESIAKTRKSIVEKDFNKSGYIKYVDIQIKQPSTTDSHYIVYLNYRPAYILCVISNLITSDNILDITSTLSSLSLSDTYKAPVDQLTTSIKDMSIFLSHIPNAYYCLAFDSFGYDQNKFMPSNNNTATAMINPSTWIIVASFVSILVIIAAIIILKQKKIDKKH